MLPAAKPIKMKVLLHQFSPLMLNLHYIFFFQSVVTRPPHCSIAALFWEMPHYNQPKGSQERKEGKPKRKKKHKTLWELSFQYAFYRVRVVRAAEIRVAQFVYVRTYCAPIATLNQNKQSRLIYLGDAQTQKTYENINWLWRPQKTPNQGRLCTCAC